MTIAATKEVTILADKSVPFTVVRQIMSTCTSAGYENVSLAVVQKGAPQVANL
jgi:biopolymer transport protein ExbD